MKVLLCDIQRAHCLSYVLFRLKPRRVDLSPLVVECGVRFVVGL